MPQPDSKQGMALCLPFNKDRFRPDLTKAEEYLMLRDYRLDPQNQLFQQRIGDQYILLVSAIVYRRAKICKKIEVEDLLQEGVLALFRAAQRFNFDLNVRFSTYATPYVHDALKKLIMAQDQIIRIPAHIYQFLRDTERFNQNFFLEYLREPTDDEFFANFGTTLTQRDKLLHTCADPHPLYYKYENEKGVIEELQDTLVAPSEELGDELNTWLCDEILKRLSAEQRLILQLRFGLNGTRESSCSDIAQILGVTQRVIYKKMEKAVKVAREIPIHTLLSRRP